MVQIPELKSTTILYVPDDSAIIFSGQLGLDLPPELGQPTPCSDGEVCWHWGTAAKISVQQTLGTNAAKLLP